MPPPITQTGSATDSWGQQKKLGSETPAGSETGTTTPDAGATTTAPSGTAGPAESTVAAGSGPAGAEQITPMPDRLRDLIVQYSRNDTPVLTDLHGLAQSLQEKEDMAAEVGLAPAVVQRTTAEIVAAASAAIRAQATQTQDGVRALLNLA